MPKTSEISLNISCLHKHESYLYPMLPFEFGIAEILRSLHKSTLKIPQKYNRLTNDAYRTYLTF